MSTSSSRERPDAGHEADHLCALIERHASSLREGGFESKVTLEGVSFHLYTSGRNQVYRVEGRSAWFLKMPRSGSEDVLSRERLGAATVAAVFSGHPAYFHPGAQRISLAHGYVLTSEVPGRTLNRAFYRACLNPFPSGWRRTAAIYGRLAQLVALFHKHEGSSQQPLLKPGRTALQSLRNTLSTVSRPSSEMREIQIWLDRGQPSDGPLSLTHGNLTPENVLVCGDRLCLIDFECCGAASPYEDVSLLCVHLVLTRALWAFPRRRAAAALEALLAGYSGIRPLESEPLLRYVAARVARYYVEHCAGRSSSPRIGGVPVNMKSLRRLTFTLLNGGLQERDPVALLRFV